MNEIAVALDQVGGLSVRRARQPGQARCATPRAATPMPRFLQIEPVGQCNLRCRMCPIEFRPESAPDAPPATIDFDLFARLLDQFG